jgi:hypothetical protein
VSITSEIANNWLGMVSDHALTTPSIKNKMIIKLIHSRVYKFFLINCLSGKTKITALITIHDDSRRGYKKAPTTELMNIKAM